MVEEEENLKRGLIKSKTNGYLRSDQVEKAELNLDQEILFQGLSEKCLESYEEFSRDMAEAYDRAIECLKSNNPEPIKPDVIDNETFQGILKKFFHEFSASTKSVVHFIKTLPGFSYLDVADLAVLLEHHSMIIYLFLSFCCCFLLSR